MADSIRSRIPSIPFLNTAASRSTDDFSRQSPNTLRPIPHSASRDTSPARHGRLPSLDLRNARSSQALAPSTGESTPRGHLRYASLGAGPPSSHLPARSPAFSADYGQSPLTTPMNGQTPTMPLELQDAVLMPPPPIGGTFSDRMASSPTGSRSSSRVRGRPETPIDSRPDSRANSPAREWFRPGTPTDSSSRLKKKTWMPGKSHNRNESGSSINLQQQWAFVVGPDGKQPYEGNYLFKGQPVPELWNDQGNLFVHLFDRESSYGPSFKVDYNIISSSKLLLSLSEATATSKPQGQDLSSQMRHASLDGSHRPASNRNSYGSPEISPTESGAFDQDPLEFHLYLPLGLNPAPGTELSSEDMENIVGARNLFAFLIGQVLVGTPNQPTMFAIFNNLAGLLLHYDFNNMDGTTLGEIATACFLGYITDLQLDDVRSSREKTMEAIVLGERMKCWQLYNEGYVHGVGKWDDLVGKGGPIFNCITEVTRKRMEKSSMDLYNRIKGMEFRLQDFDIPSLFAGIGASSASNKIVNFKGWKNSFLGMRKYTMGIYKQRYGSWPPKAASKKNDFDEGGLNRMVVQELYQDFCDLYDMLVDRTSLTTRSLDPTAHDEILSHDPAIHHLRKLLSEFDRSTPPVQPPMPYDIPMVPDLSNTRRDFDKLALRKQLKEKSKTIKDDEINMALMQSYNRDAVKVTPFLESFMAFERSTGHGKSIDELIDLRIGQWIFLYVVLQSLPMVALDAPGLRWTQGVEYFLCEIPKGQPPWSKEEAAPKAYYRIAGGSGVVSLPADVVDHGVEGIFHRSHCWQASAAWSGQSELALPPSATMNSHHRHASSGSQGGRIPSIGVLQSPPTIPGAIRPGSSASPNISPRASMIGLEALQMPPSVTADGVGAPRRLSTPDANKSFDDILGPAPPVVKKKRWDSLGGN